MSLLTRFRPSPAQEQPTPQHDPTSRSRRLANAVLTVAAGLLVFLALVVPDQIGRLKPDTFYPGAVLRIPLEGLIGAAALIAAPVRLRRIMAVLLGVGLGVLTVLKIANVGFFAVLNRRFDPVLDWPLLQDGYNFLHEEFGGTGAVGIVIAIVALLVGVLVLVVRSVQRLTRVTLRHRRMATGTVTAFVAVWVVFALLGTKMFPGAPVASDSMAALAKSTVLRVPAALQDRQSFTAESQVDAFRNTPGTQLLTGLRGKDVVLSYIESYGRSAIETPALANLVNPALAAGTKQLAAAGYTARSGFLTSSTYGGGSWLAHASMQSGLWINNEQRYRQLVAGDRFTLANAFKRADWQTVAVEPGNRRAWPEGRFYGFDNVFDMRNLGYDGPKFGWSSMPDQYTLAAFQRSVYAKPRTGSLMAEITLTSSHTPWAPLPHMLDWNDVGDGSVYGPIARTGDKRSTVWKDPDKVRTAYATSVAYSVNSLVSWVTTYGKDNLVLVFLGDHQAAPIASGQGASHDVPITIVAHDPAVLDRIADWGWTPGLKPDSKAPVFKMDTFRDRFLTAFGPQAEPSR